jgi:hypothetical protein
VDARAVLDAVVKRKIPRRKVKIWEEAVVV